MQESPEELPEESRDEPREESPDGTPGPAQGPVEPVEHCLNCGTALAGQYCSECGQRARSRLISIWELVRDAFGDLFELDSRLWQTILPLMFRPGRPTRDYLMGRRARFMPPFRTYLVLSVVFFIVAFFDPERHFGILLEPIEPETAAESSSERAEEAAEAAEIRRQVLDELAAEGIVVGDRLRKATETPQQGETPELPQAPAEEDAQRETGANVQFTDDGRTIVNCNFEDVNFEGLPGWLARRLTPERLTAVCEKISADSGEEFLDRLLDNVPAALFVLLPLMALVLKILYPLSKRYYVEHLLFVLHYHAFVFLILTLEVLWSRLVSATNLPDWVGDLTVLVISIYIPSYLFRAMRRVYEQGRAITVLKFVLLVISYFIGFLFILAVTTFYTAFSI